MNCPKCGVKIGTFDIKPNCKNCGVNIFYYSQENELRHDAKVTELDFASARLLVAKIKAAFIGSKVAIARMVFLFVCIGMLVIPFANVKVSIPLYEESFQIGAIGAYNLYNNGVLLKLLDFLKADFISKYVGIAAAELVLYALTVLLAAALLVIYILSFLNIKKTAKSMYVISLICAAFCIVTAVLPFVMKSIINAGFMTASVGAGAFCSLAAFIVFALINRNMFVHEPEIAVKDVDYKRIELREKVKAGEINIDDLPLPIFETDEEREKRMNAIGGGEKKKKEKKKKKGGKDNG